MSPMNKQQIFVSIIMVVFVAVSLGAAGIYSAYRRDMRLIRARVEAGSRMIDTACGPIEYAEWGQGQPVLFFHATGGSYEQGLLMARMFVGEGFRAIAPSRYGHVRTPQAADTSAEAQADMFACLLDALDIPRVSAVGMSAGGPIAMQFALRHPERLQSLVLLSTAAYIPPSSGSKREMPVPNFVYDSLFNSDFLFWAVVRYAGSALKSAFGATPELQANLPADERASLDEMLEYMLPIRMHTDGLANDALIADTSFVTPYPLERITAPTLVVHARDDTAAVPAGGIYTAEHIPGARLILYDNGGHALLGHHAEIRGQVRAFLTETAFR